MTIRPKPSIELSCEARRLSSEPVTPHFARLVIGVILLGFLQGHSQAIEPSGDSRTPESAAIEATEATNLHRQLLGFILHAHDSEGRVYAAEFASIPNFELPEVPLPASVTALAGLAILVDFVDLGDQSPLKGTMPEAAWNKLLGRRALMGLGLRRLGNNVKTGLVTSIKSGELGTLQGIETGVAALLAGRDYANEVVRKGVMVYGAKSLAAAITGAEVALALARLAASSSADPELRKRASVLLSAAAVLRAQSMVAEQAYRDELGLPPNN